MIGQSHDYKRNGTTTLFTALNVGTGEVTAQHHKRRRRVSTRRFAVGASYPHAYWAAKPLLPHSAVVVLILAKRCQ
jgi:hypothetical protein